MFAALILFKCGRQLNLVVFPLTYFPPCLLLSYSWMVPILCSSAFVSVHLPLEAPCRTLEWCGQDCVKGQQNKSAVKADIVLLPCMVDVTICFVQASCALLFEVVDLVVNPSLLACEAIWNSGLNRLIHHRHRESYCFSLYCFQNTAARILIVDICQFFPPHYFHTVV